MKSILFSFLSLTYLASITIPAVEASDLPPPFTARYSIEKGIIQLGEAIRTFKKTSDGKLIYISDSKATGVASLFVREHVVQTTEFVVEDNRIKPLTYSYVSNKGLRVNQSYDWEILQVRSQRNDEIHNYEIPNNALDQNVYQLSLMLDLANNKRSMPYPIAENKRLEIYDIKYLGDETVDTIFGKQPVVVVQSIRKDEITTTWNAKNLYFLPVKIDRKEKSISFTAHLTSLEGFSIQNK